MNAPAKGLPRERAIDIFKGLLVVGMVYCHTLQFFSDPMIFPNAQYVIEVVNLITFSGFVFCFGYVSQLAYYAKPFRQAAPRMLVAAAKTLAAFYISGFAFRLFIDGRPLEWETIRPILLIDDMPGWSEFLISFTYVTFIGLTLFAPLKRLAERRRLGYAVAGLLLLATFFPYEVVHVTQLGPLVGTRDFASFPVLQYFPYYIVGMLFARHRIRWDARVLAGAAVATALFLWKWLTDEGHALPERFPPSLWWIVGPALVLYGYYLLSRFMERYPAVTQPFEAMGRNVLWFLLMSNILIFALENSQGPSFVVSAVDGIWVTIAMLEVICFSVWLIVKSPRSVRTVATRHDSIGIES